MENHGEEHSRQRGGRCKDLEAGESKVGPETNQCLLWRDPCSQGERVNLSW